MARFEILDILGQGGFSKVYRVRDEVEGEERAFKLFENAAGYDAVRREIAAFGKLTTPTLSRSTGRERPTTGDWYLITEFIEGESLDDYATGKRHLRDRRQSMSPSTSSEHWLPFIPTPLASRNCVRRITRR